MPSRLENIRVGNCFRLHFSAFFGLSASATIPQRRTNAAAHCRDPQRPIGGAYIRGDKLDGHWFADLSLKNLRERIAQATRRQVDP
jgi:hypothetical protein